MVSASWSVHGLPGREISRLGTDRVAQHALQDIDDLFVVRMAMRWRDVGSWRYGEFEYTHARILRAVDEVSDAQLTGFDFRGGHGVVLG